MSTPTYTKDPDAKLDYSFDWSTWLATAETISSVVWTIGTGLTEHADLATNADGIVTCWVSGGTAGTTYTIAAKITTSTGRIDERTLNVRVINR